MTWLSFLGWGLFLVWTTQVLGVWSAILRSRTLRSRTLRGSNLDSEPGFLPSSDPTNPPRVSILVPARNEEADVAESVESLLALDHPSFEVIVIDDRSTDRTAEIVGSIAARDRRCRLLRVEELPEGWLGKTHALHVGSALAQGDWFLFTDADVRFHPEALQRALHWAELARLDHLVLLPGSPAPGGGEQMLMSYFEYLFLTATGFGWVRHAWNPRAYVGVGAFNLVKRDAYEAIGGHAALRLQVVDDVQLGKRIKAHGFRQDALHGRPYVSVYWQKGVRGIIHGLEKNAFAITGYSVVRTTFGALAQFGASVLPPAVLLAFLIGSLLGPGGTASGASDASLLARRDSSTLEMLPWFLWSLLTVVTLVGVASANGYRVRYAWLHPVAATLFAFTLLRSMTRTLRRKGVRWRDSDYSLDRLRRDHF